MDDLIGRQDAFDVIDKIFPADQKRNDYTQGITCGAALAKEYIKQLSSARKQGKWVVVTRHEHYPSGKPYEQLQCPFCKQFDHNGDGRFCGYCGAELEVPKLN